MLLKEQRNIETEAERERGLIQKHRDRGRKRERIDTEHKGRVSGRWSHYKTDHGEKWQMEKVSSSRGNIRN